MACILRHWKEASTLLVCAKRSHLLIKDAMKINKALKGILTVDTNSGKIHKSEITMKPADFDYHVLYMERSHKSTYMPNLYVYPGGVAENADFSSEWCDLFSKANCDVRNIMKKVNDKCVGVASPMFTRERPKEFSHLPVDVAFRITAIRETFEETGVLMAKSFDETSIAAIRFIDFQINYTSVLNTSSDLQKWRRKVHSDPASFIELCDSLKVIPDVWSLYEWSNWHTPVYQNVKNFLEDKKEKRFDTVFYICFTENSQNVITKTDDIETTDIKFLSPFDVQYKFSSNRKVFATPQFYENSRLLTCPRFDDLVKFAVERSRIRVDRWTQFVRLYADGVVALLPGDELYPDDPDECGVAVLDMRDKNMADIKDYPAANRYFPSDLLKFVNDLEYNIPTRGRYLAPMTNVQIVDNGSKL